MVACVVFGDDLSKNGYHYRTDGLNIHLLDKVLVPVGMHNNVLIGTVVGMYIEDQGVGHDFPKLASLKTIIAKADREELFAKMHKEMEEVKEKYMKLISNIKED